jgi:signal transduction histidine kinase
MSETPSSETPTPPWGLRLENGPAEGIEHLQTRLLHIGLFLLTVVVLGGGAGVLMVATEESRALVVAVSVVAGCVLAVLVALVAAMSATRAARPLLMARQRPVHAPVMHAAPPPTSLQPLEPLEPFTRRPEPAPLWAHTGEQQAIHADDPGQRREVFVKLARRLQSLINRAIKRIDELEQDNEDPVLLDGLYEIDHLFTLARRQGENLAVLGGEAPQRRSNKPVSVYAVLLAAVSEAEHYRQIAIVPVEDVEIHGHAVAEIIHLLAELLENATRFTSPDGPKVEVRAQKVTAGLAIEVQDRGLGMSYEDLERINHLLDGSTRIDISELLEDGRIGLAVVRELARRHDIRVRLQSNIFGGVAAAVVIPTQLLSETGPAEGRRRAQPSVLRREPGQQTAVHERREPAALTAPEPTRRVEQQEPVRQPAPQPTAQPATQPTGATAEQARRADGFGNPEPVRRPEPPALATPEPTSTLPAPKPVTVPAPTPVPTTQAAASPGLGPIRPGGRRHRVTDFEQQEAAAKQAEEEELPVLPQRAPGRSYSDLRAGGNGGITEDFVVDPADGERPPPLPQRRGTHLREELLEPPAPTKPVPGHNTSLMKTVQAGREHWLAEQKRDASTDKSNRGDSTTWPTT